MPTKSSRTSIDHRSSRSKGSKDKSLYSIKEHEETPTEIASEIVNEIVDDAMDQINQIYLDKQTVKFVVHCAHEALIRIIKLYFYQHNSHDFRKEFWTPDTPIEPSPPDSWAVNQVEELHRQSDDKELNTISKIKLDSRHMKLGDDKEESSLCICSDDEDHESEISVVAESVVEDMEEIIEDVITQLPSEYELDIELEPKKSNFTMVAEGVKDYEEFKMKPQYSKISAVVHVKKQKPEFEFPPSPASKKAEELSDEEKKEEDVEFPHFRNCARYKAHLEAPDEDDAKKNKKKK